MTAYLDIASSLSAANATYNIKYQEHFAGDLPGIYPAYCEVIPSKDKTMSYHFMGAKGVFRKWVGSRVEQYSRAYNHTSTFEKWEVTQPVQRVDMAYDTTGMVGRYFQKFMASSAYVYDNKAFASLVSNSGYGPTCYDGQYVLSTAHPHASGGGTNSNASTNGFSRANYESARLAMATWTLENGENAEVVPTAIICGEYNRAKVFDVFNVSNRTVAVDATGAEASTAAIGVTNMQNIYEGELKVIIDKRLTGSTYQYYWYLVDETQLDRAIVLQENRKPEPIILDKMTDPARVNRDVFIYSLEADFGFTGGAWWQIYGNVATE